MIGTYYKKNPLPPILRKFTNLQMIGTHCLLPPKIRRYTYMLTIMEKDESEMRKKMKKSERDEEDEEVSEIRTCKGNEVT